MRDKCIKSSFLQARFLVYFPALPIGERPKLEGGNNEETFFDYVFGYGGSRASWHSCANRLPHYRDRRNIGWVEPDRLLHQRIVV
jgi:hypothetical protein